MPATTGTLSTSSAATSASNTLEDVQANVPKAQRRATAEKGKKHRRTRNGCYVCRVRRIKCDEIHPICLRCQKADRPCKFPEPRSDATKDREPKDAQDVECKPVAVQRCKPAQKSDGNSASQHGSIFDCDEESSAVTEDAMHSSSEDSEDDQSADRQLSSKVNEIKPSSSIYSHPKETESHEEKFSHLSSDLKHYLRYHLTRVNFHHYFFKHDADLFLHTSLIDKALSFEPLMYALVGFAAFQKAVADGHISDFLEYYNKSISLLRHSLASDRQHSDATLLTVLQLATFEEYLGDLVSLLNHQQAAHRLLTEIFNVSSILETDLSRKILDWFLRFDLTSGILSGSETLAKREWYTAISEYYTIEAERHPEIHEFKILKGIFRHRVTCKDLGDLFAKISRDEVSREVFRAQCQFHAQEIISWKRSLDPIFRDEKYQVRNPQDSMDSKDKDAVGPFIPAILYRGQLTALNYMCADYLAIQLILEYKKHLILGEPLPEEVPSLTRDLCGIFEAIDSPFMPPEAILKTQGVLGLASLFLPKDKRHIQWKLAKIERLGYTYPSTFRHRMAGVWGKQEMSWWLEDEEEIPAFVRKIRSFQDHQTPNFHEKQRDQDQRDMRGIFEQLTITDNNNTGRTPSEGV